jgi:class 3 adenylate cyclase
MGADEARMLRLLDVHNQLIQQAVNSYNGHVIKTIGDAFLVDFPSVVHEARKDANVQARQMFERTIELDSHYAQAYSYLSLTYLIEWFYQWNFAPQTLEWASELARQAVMLDESFPSAHTLLGAVCMW